MSCSDKDAFNLGIMKIRGYFALFSLIVRTIGMIAIVWLIVDGLKNIAASAPDQIGALAKVIEALKLSEIIPWCVSCICGSCWFFERKGKKRAIREKSRLQKLVEADDPDRTTCGLTETGDTPED